MAQRGRKTKVKNQKLKVKKYLDKIFISLRSFFLIVLIFASCNNDEKKSQPQQQQSEKQLPPYPISMRTRHMDM